MVVIVETGIGIIKDKKIDIKQLHVALLNAFPSRADLRILMSYELNENLDTIASDSNLNDTIFDLIMWANSRGRLEELAQAALKTRPDNSLIRFMAQQAGFDLPVSSLALHKDVAEMPFVGAEKNMKDDTRAGEISSFQRPDMDTSTIFIARREHLQPFSSLLKTWPPINQSKTDSTSQGKPSANNKLLGRIVIVSGQGGRGKSTLIRHYHHMATKLVSQITISNIIDWEDSENWIFSPANTTLEVDPSEYFDLLCRKLARALNQKEEDFKEYQAARKNMDEILWNIDSISKKMRADSNYAFLHRLTATAPMTKVVLQTGSLPKDEATLGKTMNVSEEYVSHFVKTIKQKLGHSFADFLQPAQFFGSALGRDLHHFGGQTLIFFDTYERAIAGDAYLRIVMHAAGANVGWVIASRANLWSYFPSSSCVYKDITFNDRAYSIDLDNDINGSFTIDDIMTYFSYVQQKNGALATLRTEQAQRILSTTKGIPLIVRIVAEIYATEHHLDFLQEVTEQAKIIDQFIRYYFRYVLDNEEIKTQVYALALLKSISDYEAIIICLGFDQKQNSIKLFQRNHGFLFSGQNQQQLQPDIRHFLRHWLLDHLLETQIEQRVKKLKDLYQTRINNLEKRPPYYRNVQERLDDDEWVDAYLDLTEICYWHDVREGVLYSLLFIIASAGSLPKNQHIRDKVVHMSDFFNKAMKKPVRVWWGLTTQCLNTSLDKDYTVAVQAHRLQELLRLMHEDKFQCSSPLAAHMQELIALLWWQLGKTYQNHDEREALKWCKKAFKVLYERDNLQEDILTIYWMRANSAYQKKSYQECRDLLQEALDFKYEFTETVRHNFADFHYSLGNTYAAQKKYRQAICQYQYTIEIDPGHFYAYVNLGNVYFGQQEYHKAIKEYNQSIRIEAHDATLYYNRANAYAALHDYPTSLHDFEQAITLDATHANAHLNCGHVYALQGYRDLAMDQYKHAYEIMPEDIQIAWNWHWANFTKTLVVEDILSVLKVIAALDEQHPIAHLCRGIEIWIKDHDAPGALRKLEKARALEPEGCDIYFWQGMFFASLAQISEATEAINEAMKRNLAPVFLTPLRWLENVYPAFVAQYADLMLENHH